MNGSAKLSLGEPLTVMGSEIPTWLLSRVCGAWRGQGCARWTAWPEALETLLRGCLSRQGLAPGVSGQSDKLQVTSSGTVPSCHS